MYIGYKKSYRCDLSIQILCFGGQKIHSSGSAHDNILWLLQNSKMTTGLIEIRRIENRCHKLVVITVYCIAGRALSSVIAKFKHLRNVGFTTYTKLYNCCVKPILEYSSAVWKDKKYIEHIKVFSRAIRYFLGLPRTAPIDGMCGDMGWIAPAYSLSLNRLRLWNKLCAMHPDRLTKQIFEWDWLKKNNN